MYTGSVSVFYGNTSVRGVRYDSRVRPVMNHSKPTTVSFSMSLYQILSINEKQQKVDLNVWAIQKWNDDFLGWNPYLYGMINTTYCHLTRYGCRILISVTGERFFLMNYVVMNREETERYINVVVTTNYWKGEKGAEVKFMYPALYRTSCLLDIRFFPYDQQACKLTISSWTSSKSDINYEPEYESVNMDNFLPNEEWVVVSFNIKRVEEKFVCCPEPWVLLEAVLVVRRKPLYYIVNLVIPTSVITLVAVTGFFTAASTSSERREKLSLGIDSLLAMSILMMMVYEQMPTSSDFVPLFGIFYLSITLIILSCQLISVYIKYTTLFTITSFTETTFFKNEKQQNVDLNVWAIQIWNDDFLGWNPYLYGMINTTILPFDAIWLPDTYLYNSVVMNREETERYINVVVTTNYWKGEKGAEVKFMYPALYRTSCLLHIRREKLSLGIDSLLAMSILMMMVSEQMPTSSDFVPLFGIFYLSIIFIIFIGTLFTAFILNVHLQKMYAKLVSPIVSYIFFGRIAQWLRMRPPTMLLELWNETGETFGKKDKTKAKRVEMKNQKMPKVTSSSSGLNLLRSNSGSGRAPLAAPISARSYISMDDMKRGAARRNWRRLVKKINSNKQNGVKNCGGGERGQLRQAGRKKVPAAISVPHGEPGPLMLSASAISAFSVTGDSTILESKLKRSFRNNEISKFIKSIFVCFHITLNFTYALEWEYLALVLDRALLIVFSLVVFTVTSIMILVGEAMHLSYELAAKEF
ncbi:hypothetical protein CRE_21070 [Caenorhabditis remanei]|uniref:Neurotransmitter-gated ion-channel ligand-binding domain-containing protein n=1 Tax=Caenorhabditis remanei TaxID=31234 RepID=E3NRA2_CAERE|nr:hypothetical protein CRE_21070 [Caenorhabditis remanei]